jgi:heat shock factor-binding protein 1
LIAARVLQYLWAAILCLFLDHTALDEMGTKIDELEQSVNDLKAEMGTTEAPAKKPEEAKPADSA